MILIVTTLGTFAYNTLMLMLQPTDGGGVRVTSIVLLALFGFLCLNLLWGLLPSRRHRSTKVLRVGADGVLREVELTSPKARAKQVAHHSPEASASNEEPDATALNAAAADSASVAHLPGSTVQELPSPQETGSGGDSDK